MALIRRTVVATEEWYGTVGQSDRPGEASQVTWTSISTLIPPLHHRPLRRHHLRWSCPCVNAAVSECLAKRALLTGATWLSLHKAYQPSTHGSIQREQCLNVGCQLTRLGSSCSNRGLYALPHWKGPLRTCWMDGG